MALGLLLLGIAVAVAAVAAYEALTAAREDANRNFGNNCVGSPTMPCSAESMHPISPERANSLFREMASKADSIPFDYPNDCCYSRAHEMCRDMQAEGIDCGKVWNYQNPGPPSGPPLTVSTPNSPTGQVTWRYHVAPIVNVQGDDGVVRPMVIDPSMFDHPVTVDEWKAAQNAPNSVTEYTDATPYYRSLGDAQKDYDYDYSQTQIQLIRHMNSRDNQDPDFVRQLEERRKTRVAANTD